MKHPSFLVLVTMIASLSMITGCSSAPKVTRTEIDKTVDLSGRWNDTDSRLVAQEMIKDCLQRPWVNNFTEKFHRDPVVIVGTINNKSQEHIDSEVFIKDLERNLLNSAKVKFVASSEEREDVRDERADQKTGYTARETIKPKGRETGADFMLQGSVHSIKDEIKGKYVILYQVNLELVNLTDNQKIWIGQKEIKKVVSRPGFSL